MIQRWHFVVSALVVLPITLSCAPSGRTEVRAKYDVALVAVERPAKATERYGPISISKGSEEGINKYVFEDSLVKVGWATSDKGFGFWMINKTEHSIRLPWDEAAIVDDKGRSHRVIHSGVKYIDRNNSQPPSVIVRKGAYDDLVVPSDNVYFESGAYGGWQEQNLFEPHSLETWGYKPDQIADFKAAAQRNVGKRFQVLLPLQIEDVVNDYIFTFEVKELVFDDRSAVPPTK